MAGLTDHDRGVISAALRLAGRAGARSDAALTGQLASTQRALCDLVRVCERLDRRIGHLEGILDARPVPVGLTAAERIYVRRLAARLEELQHQLDVLNDGPVPYRLTTAAEAYLTIPPTASARDYESMFHGHHS